MVSVVVVVVLDGDAVCSDAILPAQNDDVVVSAFSLIHNDTFLSRLKTPRITLKITMICMFLLYVLLVQSKLKIL